MRVAHITLYPPKGETHASSSNSGVASYSKNLITNIDNVDQAVVCNIVTKASEAYEENNIKVRRIFWRQPSYIFAVHRELKKLKPDVVHVQQELALFGNVITAYLLQWLVWLWRDRTVVTIHGIVDPKKVTTSFVRENNSRLPVWIVRLAFRVLYTPLMKWARRVVVHEKYFKEIAVQSYGIAPQKVVVIPHGVETFAPTDTRQARRSLSIAKDAKVVLFMGYATGYKGLDLLIEGFAQYAEREPKAYLIIGSGRHPKLKNDSTYLAEYRRLQEKAAALIPLHQYRWDGFLAEDQIGLYYSACDVSLYPYTTAMSSSGPMSFAIGYERPFLVSEAFKDVFKDYPHLLFDRHPQKLAERLEYFFTNQNDYISASSVLKRDRTWRSVGQKTASLYSEIKE
jgi:glycosyltransferase involved in cell wall biosynthesis